MVTFAQAQERGERWVNADMSAYETREVKVREFDLGFVVWSEPREDGPTTDDGSVRLVIARDSGEATLWPGLPIGELIRRYEEEYGTVANDAVPDPPQRLDLEATSFLLSPPQWLQDAADRMGIPDRRPSAAGGPAAPAPQEVAPAAGGGIAYRRPGDSAAPAAAARSGGIDFRRPAGGSGAEVSGDAGPAGSAAPDGPPSPAPASGGVDYRRPPAVPAQGSGAPVSRDEAPAAGGWAGKTVSDSGQGQSVAVPETVLAPPLSGADLVEDVPSGAAEARTELLPGGSSLPPTMIAPPAPEAPVPPRPGVPLTVGGSLYPPPGGPAVPLPPPGGVGGAADIADMETARAVRGSVPPPAGPPPRSPDAPPPPPGAFSAGPPAPGAPAYGSAAPAGYAGPPPPPGAGTPPPGGGDPHYAATMLAGPSLPPPPPGAGGPHMPPPPPGQGTPPPGGGDPHYAATMLAGPSLPPPPPPGAGGPGMPPPPPPPPGVGGPGTAPPGPLGVNGPGAAPPPPPAYGYPQAAVVPTVGPGYMAVLRYRGQDGSEQQLIRRSAPGTPHPEWQILHELRSLGVRPDQVLELHTELESCDLPGGYCTRMIRETWPQVRISHTAPYGRDHAGRRQGVQHLLTHQGELHQVAGAPARPQPQRVPMPDPHTVPRVPPVPLEVIGQELAGAFGPQGVFRFDQRAVSRQGVPDIVAQTLVWAGLPLDFGPFFWAQAQPGQPVPTLAELAAQRGVRPASDAGSYLVMGNDFGRQLCVQYGTAHIVAVPLEAGPGGQPVPPQFVNSSLPEFARCLALLGRMWRLRIGLTPDQAGRWTVDFQAQLAAQDPAAIASPDNWWSVLIEQMWDGLL
ncbi:MULTISPECIES: SUKH-4 family immunity protein [unclassified Streptomyces]|uniref:SUKH-4 family immunity protein n=1 Tax=unclassified Streptomyces TaxID=2593676 RepID=UPI002E28AF7E|nr:SUKH-4 family immunity protein [Streptomyces sp. NBC_00223]